MPHALADPGGPANLAHFAQARSGYFFGSQNKLDVPLHFITDVVANDRLEAPETLPAGQKVFVSGKAHWADADAEFLLTIPDGSSDDRG